MENIVRPFIPYKAFDWMKEFITPDMIVFEYGSGMSTIWLSKHVSKVISVENDARWFGIVNQEIGKHACDNVTISLLSDAESYSQHINTHEDVFDLVFVDGRFRRECMEECFDKAKYAIFLDNSDADHYADAYDVMKSYKSGQLIDFKGKGLNPYTGEDLPMEWQASVFIKER